MRRGRRVPQALDARIADAATIYSEHFEDQAELDAPAPQPLQKRGDQPPHLLRLL
jgi:hypothetical protein